MFKMIRADLQENGSNIIHGQQIHLSCCSFYPYLLSNYSYKLEHCIVWQRMPWKAMCVSHMAIQGLRLPFALKRYFRVAMANLVSVTLGYKDTILERKIKIDHFRDTEELWPITRIENILFLSKPYSVSDLRHHLWPRDLDSMGYLRKQT